MRIVQMISKNDRYGAQRVFLDQVAALRDLGQEVVVVARGNAGYVADAVRSLGVRYHGIPMKGLSDLLFLRRLVRELGIDVIHSTLDRADYLGAAVGMLTRRPIVSSMAVRRYYPAFRFMDRITVVSRLQQRLLERKGIPSERITLLRPGIDVTRFSKPDPDKRDAWRKKLHIERYSMVFCHIASMHQRKAHRVSLELVKACKRRGEDPLLVIIGDPLEGEYYESLLRQAQADGITENVVFTGWTPEVPEILSLSHFTVLPSENEALGLVLMEGMAAGTPIVAREGEGGAELVEEYGTGLLYRPSEGVTDLADKILVLWRDPVRYKELSEKCRNVAQTEFSMVRFGERLMSVYRDITGQV